jgi:DNA-binding NarL/FixJ family response regulator
MKRRIFVVDDHPLIRRGYSYLLSCEDDLEMCGEAGSVAEAIEKISLSIPDLVVTDIALEGTSGLELIKWLNVHMPRIPVLVVSMHDEITYGWRSLRAGARGYIVKGRTEMAIIEAIRKLIRGGLFISEQMTEHLVGSLNGRQGWVEDPLHRLTARELEVYTQCGRGLTAKEIGAVLHVSPKTVETHRIRIREKLGCSSNSELVRRAAQSIAIRDGKNAF